MNVFQSDMMCGILLGLTPGDIPTVARTPRSFRRKATPRNGSTPTEFGRDVLQDALQSVSVVLDTELIWNREQ